MARMAGAERTTRCLGIDLGSSSIKAAVLNLSHGTVERIVVRPFPLPIANLPSGHFEIDPEAVVASVRELAAELVAAEPRAQAIFLSSQMGGVVLVDEEHRPVTNYLSWRDERTLAAHSAGRSFLAITQERIGPKRLAELGNECKPGSATTLLFWMKTHGLLRENATPLTLGGYVGMALADSSSSNVLVTEPTEAIGTLDFAACTWHQEAFRALGLETLRWPCLQTYEKPIGAVKIGGIELSIHPAVGDHQCSLLGVDLAPRELSINVSTGSQVSLLTQKAELGTWQTRCGFDGAYLSTITHLPAGRSLNVLVDLLTSLGRPRREEVWPEILAAVDHSLDSDLEVDLSFFDGPMGTKGSIRNISLENLTVGGIFRAAFRNMANNYRASAERLSSAGSWDRVVLSGGLTQRIPFLHQLLADRFPYPWRDCPEGEDALVGLLRLAERTYAQGRTS